MATTSSLTASATPSPFMQHARTTRKPIRSSPLAGPALSRSPSQSQIQESAKSTPSDLNEAERMIALNDHGALDSPDALKPSFLSPPRPAHIRGPHSRSLQEITRLRPRPTSLYLSPALGKTGRNHRRSYIAFDDDLARGTSDDKAQDKRRSTSSVLAVEDGDGPDDDLAHEASEDDEWGGVEAKANSQRNPQARTIRLKHSASRTDMKSLATTPGGRPKSILLKPTPSSSSISKTQSIYSYTPSSPLSSSSSLPVSPNSTSTSLSLPSTSARSSTSYLSPPPKPKCPAGDAMWMMQNTYSEVPKFSRLGLGAPGVIMPVSAKAARGNTRPAASRASTTTSVPTAPNARPELKSAQTAPAGPTPPPPTLSKRHSLMATLSASLGRQRASPSSPSNPLSQIAEHGQLQHHASSSHKPSATPTTKLILTLTQDAVLPGNGENVNNDITRVSDCVGAADKDRVSSPGPHTTPTGTAITASSTSHASVRLDAQPPCSTESSASAVGLGLGSSTSPSATPSPSPSPLSSPSPVQSSTSSSEISSSPSSSSVACCSSSSSRSSSSNDSTASSSSSSDTPTPTPSLTRSSSAASSASSLPLYTPPPETDGVFVVPATNVPKSRLKDEVAVVRYEHEREREREHQREHELGREHGHEHRHYDHASSVQTPTITITDADVARALENAQRAEALNNNLGSSRRRSRLGLGLGIGRSFERVRSWTTAPQREHDVAVTVSSTPSASTPPSLPSSKSQSGPEGAGKSSSAPVASTSGSGSGSTPVPCANMTAKDNGTHSSSSLRSSITPPPLVPAGEASVRGSSRAKRLRPFSQALVEESAESEDEGELGRSGDLEGPRGGDVEDIAEKEMNTDTDTHAGETRGTSHIRMRTSSCGNLLQRAFAGAHDHDNNSKKEKSSPIPRSQSETAILALSSSTAGGAGEAKKGGKAQLLAKSEKTTHGRRGSVRRMWDALVHRDSAKRHGLPSSSS